ncbi:MAG TPA: hypothetical protein VGJ13_13305 [Pseudonocardiaceae bacterium]|jgi:hypothetical protein
METSRLVSQLREAAAEIMRQVQEVVKLVMRALDMVALQATRVQTRTQTELIFGPVTVSLASGVIIARADGAVVH